MLFSEIEQLDNFPCLTCPFINSKEKKGCKYPLCNIYSNQDSIGLESCQEIANYIKENGNKELFFEHLQNGNLILSF